MKPLLLLTICLALTPTVYPAQDIDRSKATESESDRAFGIDKHGNEFELKEGFNDNAVEVYYSCKSAKFPCKWIQKGDLLEGIEARWVVLYCDNEHPIVEIKTSHPERKYTCRYNGMPYKLVHSNPQRRQGQ